MSSTAVTNTRTNINVVEISLNGKVESIDYTTTTTPTSITITTRTAILWAKQKRSEMPSEAGELITSAKVVTGAYHSNHPRTKI